MYTGFHDFCYIEKDGTVIPPLGPCSIWPKERGMLSNEYTKRIIDGEVKGHIMQDPQLRANLGDMAKGLVDSGIKFITEGYGDPELSKSRYEACEKCPFFIRSSKLCSECGCYMPAKTKLKAATCPKGIW